MNNEEYRRRQGVSIILASEVVKQYPHVIELFKGELTDEEIEAKASIFDFYDLVRRALEEFECIPFINGTPNIIDHKTATAKCDLCGYEGIRYEYFLSNKISGKTLGAGSNCIIKYNVCVQGGVSNIERAKRKLQWAPKVTLVEIIEMDEDDTLPF